MISISSVKVVNEGDDLHLGGFEVPLGLLLAMHPVVKVEVEYPYVRCPVGAGHDKSKGRAGRIAANPTRMRITAIFCTGGKTNRWHSIRT